MLLALVQALLVSALQHPRHLKAPRQEIANIVLPIVNISVVSPTGKVRAGDKVTVSWVFAPGFKPHAGDFVGAFAPSGADGAPMVNAVTARQCLSAACRDSRSVGANTNLLEFPALVHSRTNYTFLYFSPQRSSGCWDKPALAFTRAIQFIDLNEPAGVHLSLTGHAGEAVVSFSTLSGIPAVRFGPSGSPLTKVITGTTTSFTAADLCGLPANNSASGDYITPYNLNTVVISGLRAHERVDYQVGTVNGSYSKTWTFTMPAVGTDTVTTPPAHPLRVAIFGDMGQDLAYNDRVGSQPASVATLASLELVDPDLVLHIGDISYARGSGSMWPAFMQQVQHIAATRPYLTGIGNHEMDFPEQPFNWTRGGDSGGECGVPYSKHFTNPGVGSGAGGESDGSDAGGESDGSGAGGGSRIVGPGARESQHKTAAHEAHDGTAAAGASSAPKDAGNANAGGAAVEAVHWWSLDAGSLHLVTLSSEADWTEGSPQHRWLDADLAAVDRSATPFVVLSTHRPFYCSGNGWLTQPYSVGYMAAQRAAIEPLLAKYRVDLAIVGHVHKYERTCPMASNGRCASASEHGTVHLVMGAAGEPYQTGCDNCSAWEHLAIEVGPGFQRRAGGSARQFAAPMWSEFRTTAFGYGVLTVHNKSALQVGE
jgi:hypothetical protein